MSQTYNVLFLCAGNSGRSILAEALLKKIGKGRFQVFSAGSSPTGDLHPHVIPLLQMLGHPTEAFRSKSWDEFTEPGAPEMDFIFALCDETGGEACPAWPGEPVTAHWAVPDPAKVTRSEAETAAAFDVTAQQLRHRLELFAALPLESVDRISLHHHLADIHAGGAKVT